MKSVCDVRGLNAWELSLACVCQAVLSACLGPAAGECSVMYVRSGETGACAVQFRLEDE